MNNYKNIFLGFAIIATAFFAGISRADAAVPVYGNIRVCQVIVNGDTGLPVSTSAGLPAGSSSVSFSKSTTFDTTAFSQTFDTSTFTTNTDLNGVPALCTPYNQVNFGTYFYSKAGMTGASGIWKETKFYDGVNIFSLSVAAPYSNVLFDNDPSNDFLANINSDGSIVLDDEGIYDRTLVIVDTFVKPATPVIPVANAQPYIVLSGSNPVILTVGSPIPTDPGAKAYDTEDGEITNSIVKTGSINTSIAGIYTVSYDVKDSKGLSANTVTRTYVVQQTSNLCSVSFLSDTTNTIVGAGSAVATYSGHPWWTANIPSATWIWNSYKVVDPLATTTVTFQKQVTINSLGQALLTFSADNSVKVYVNGTLVHTVPTGDTYFNARVIDITSALHTGTNTLSFEVTNWALPNSAPETNPAGLLYKLQVFGTSTDNCLPPANTAPTITLAGLNPTNLVVGQPWTEPGYTATDKEDGNITNKVVVTGTVNTSVAGTYTLTYSVTDSGGLSTSTTRTIVVAPVIVVNTPPTITLTGLNPVNLTVGQNWTEPGYTATDKEDGNITNKVVVTGTVNTSVTGTYTLVYTVTDSGGLSAVTTRQVIVSRPTMYLPKMPACSAVFGKVLAVNKTDNIFFATGYHNSNIPSDYNVTTPGSLSSGDTLDWYWLHVTGVDNYADFDLGTTTTKVRVYPTSDHGPYPDEFNEYNVFVSTDKTTWVPASSTALYVDDINNVRTHDGVRDFVSSQSFGSFRYVRLAPNGISGDDMEIDAVESCGFEQPINTPPIITLKGLNPDTITAGQNWTEPGYTANDKEDGVITDKVVVTGTVGTTTPGTYTLTYSVTDSGGLSTSTTRQIIVKPVVIVNTPPVITLVGANPIKLTVGDIFTDPGATAYDKEDGNITNKIIVTGTVATTTPGTYTLTYSVTDSGGLSATTTRQVIVYPQSTPVNACTFVSDSTTSIVGGGFATSTYAGNVFWTANIPGATWIWDAYKVADPIATTSLTFEKKFTATSTPSQVLLSIAGDNSFLVKLNGTVVASSTGGTNYSSVQTFDITNATTAGVNTLTFEVTNFGMVGGTAESNPAGLLYKVEITGGGCGTTPINTPPTITLIGSNPATITVGQAWNDPGATASDKEDGNITNKIIVTGTVATTTPGTYTLTYSVTDSGGLSATTTRQVVVEPVVVPTRGTIRFCAVVADADNAIATSSTGLPFGTFTLKLGTTTDIVGSTLQTKSWTSSTFAPNAKMILNTNDADCVTYSNLDLGSYYYSELAINGAQWIVSTTSPKYNDQLTQPVNNIFDFFSYSGELFTATTTDDVNRNVNADGQITLSADRRDATLVVLARYNKEAPACMIPDITSSLSASGQVGLPFSYTLTATSTATSTISYTIASSSLPAGLSVSGDTISGTPTVNGTFTVEVSAKNDCGLTTKTLTITIAQAPNVCTSNCGGGGGGGGGGNGPIITSLTISNEKVVALAPNVALVTWNTNLPATRQVGYGNDSVEASFIVAPFGYATSTVRVSDPLLVTHSVTIPIVAGKTYYFRPVSTDFKTTVAGKELVLNPAIVTGGTTDNACYYLYDYLKQGWDNNPVEVKKLQVFLRDLEGFDVKITGVYDDQTVVALNAFQNRYKDDILTPWGHTAPTSFTYITTKKKVNEIYCKRAFPVTPQQQAEIDAFRAFLEGLKNSGVTLTPPTQQQIEQPAVIETNEVGVVPVTPTPSVSNNQLTTLAGSEPTSIADRLTANVISSGKQFGQFAAAVVAWPWKWAEKLFGGKNQCTTDSLFSNWLNWILIILILTMAYLWYRERREYKKTLEINKEIDLME